ncbi:DUF6381 family protein [Streptomyces sp. NPDC057445]|uniref:DUF6381 family protein n=1 Tax=Streptomyces sp. NPDC057445 TaxID=3346136 RepID=UPI0036897423
MDSQRDPRIRAEALQEKADQLASRAERSDDPGQRERLRLRAQELRERGEHELRLGPDETHGDFQEDYPS